MTGLEVLRLFVALFAAAIRLAVAGEQIVRPDLFVVVRGALRRLRRFSGGIGGAIPIFRWIGDSPNISVIVKRHSNQKILPVVAQRQTIHNMRGSATAPRQITEKHGSFDGQSLRGAKAAALRTDHQSNASGAERMPPIHAGYSQRDLNPQTRAAPCRFGCQYFHLVLLTTP